MNWFLVSSGVRQGCVAAPQLMRYFQIAEILGILGFKIAGMEFRLRPRLLTDVDYADDVTIFAHSRANIETALSSLQAEASKLGLSINWTKTKF